MAEEEITVQDICIKLNKKLLETEAQVKAEARIRRAFMDKVSKDIIEEKVNSQLNSIKVQINQINSKFSENSKHFEDIKELIDVTISKYEKNLNELSDFYDNKIEQLILRKVELEGNLIGIIFNEEYLNQRLIVKNSQKENDNVKKSIKENIKSLFDKIKIKKKENEPIDSKSIRKLMDGQDIAKEMELKLSSKVEVVEETQKKNQEEKVKVEKEIEAIAEEIEKLNERKKNSINEAMEVGSKEIDTNIRKPRLIKKIKRFFASRFNTAKVIENSVINPLNDRINDFAENELSSMKG